ncbi:hypothetical protein [Rhodoblastus sp.]|uniref:hypothetical protein n=1 Tax=Rhodoblastus sp. TaxID=1962975 RepID=UPI003F96099F
MKRSIALAAALSLALIGSSSRAAEDGVTRHHHHRRHTTQGMAPVPRAESRPSGGDARARQPVEPSARGNPGAEQGEDGMSTNPDNCNTGCVGGNPD